MTTDTFWISYKKEIAAYLRRRIANPADAEDLLQDVLLKAHSALPDLTEDTPLKPWLFQVARNSTIDFYRRKAKRAGDAARLPEDLWHQEGEENLHELDRCIAPLLLALSPEDAEILRRVDLEGMRQRDYAEAESLPYSTVKSRVQSARRHLRHAFERCCAFQFDSQGRIIDFEARSKTCGSC